MNALKKLFGGDLRQFGMLITLVVMIAFFQIATGGLVLTPTNMMNLLNGNSYILILSIGMVLVIIAGHIDLSVGSVAAVVGIIVAIATHDFNVPWWAAVLLGLLIGVLIGAWDGWWMAYVGIPGFIVTLAGMMLFRGLNQAIGHSLTVPVPEEIQYLGGGYLPEIGPSLPFNNLTVLLGVVAIAALAWGQLRSRAQLAKINAATTPMWVTIVRIVAIGVVLAYLTMLYATGRPGTSFPVAGLILVVLVIIYTFVSQRTIIGRHVYAIGGNRNAAELSGVKSKKVYFLVMLNMSVLSALAGIMFVGRSTASGPFDGVGWELDAIAAVFIGGAAVSGGVGTVVGSMIGGFVMAVLNNGLQLMGIGADATQMIKGMVLLLAVAVDVLNKKQGRPSILGYLMPKKAAPAVTGGPLPQAPAGPIEDQASVDPNPAA